MSQPHHYLAPELGSSTPSPATQSPTAGLPQDLLTQASHRLGIISLIGAVLWTLGLIIYHLIFRLPGAPAFPSPGDWISLSAILCSLALYAFSRRNSAHPELLLNLGLVYMVVTCADIAVAFFLDPIWRSMAIIPSVTWNGAIVLLCAAIVPATPRRMAFAAALAAAMHPLAFLYGHFSGLWDGPLIAIATRFYPDVLLAGTAVMISHVVTALGRQVSKAREMGSYRMVSLLGKGGMGEVWRASHRMLARDAAIKLIHPYMLQREGPSRAETLRLRFEQEAKATASLRSPHTVELYDFGVTAAGVFYYAMEFLDGIDLQTLVRRFGPQPPARVNRILRQVCRSLAEAHRRGMIHRDIKPTNIFLCRMGEELDFVKVLDFGLVKIVGHDIHLTRDDSTLGTPAYMAPEAALGKEDTDARADLYSLGCVAYWLLTGHLVFDEKGPTPTMMAHINKPPLPPSQRTELPIPAHFENVILSCLEKDPGRRPATAAELHHALEECAPLPAWTRLDAQAWWHTHLPAGAPPPSSPDSGSTVSATAVG
ncbi:MAG: serine/threonine protein kinase [Bryobacterales bacterium]|nr:serine/threonine protein kinase [Bryobacterales bacterium]